MNRMYSRIWCAVTAALLVCTAWPAPAAAQARDRTRVWAAFGLGGVASTEDGGAAFMGEIVFQKQPHHMAIRGLAVFDIYGSSGDSFGEIDVLYGRVVTGRVGHAVIASGLAYTDVNDICPAECEGRFEIGVPIVAELALRPVPVLGLGIQAFGNLNRKASYGGLAFFLQLGWLP